MSGLRLTISDLKKLDSNFSSAARQQLQDKVIALEAIEKKRHALNKKAGKGNAVKSSKNKVPAPESPAQANLRHLLNSDPLLKQYKNKWVENYVGASPTSKYEIDFAMPDLKIGIEVDGWQYHGKYKEAFLRDREKDFSIKANGWVLLRIQAGLLLNYRKLSNPLERIHQFLECWVKRQVVLKEHFNGEF